MDCQDPPPSSGPAPPPRQGRGASQGVPNYEMSSPTATDFEASEMSVQPPPTLHTGSDEIPPGFVVDCEDGRRPDPLGSPSVHLEPNESGHTRRLIWGVVRGTGLGTKAENTSSIEHNMGSARRMDTSSPSSPVGTREEDAPAHTTDTVVFWRRTQIIILYIVATSNIIWLVVLTIYFFKYWDLGHSPEEKDPTNQQLPPALDESETLSRILERGSLVCAVSKQDGYNSINPDTGEREGFEIDLARAIAAGIFGTDLPVTFIDVELGERFKALNSSDVDLMIASASVTMERDLLESTTKSGFKFSTPYLYNGLSFAGVPEYVECADQLNFTGTCSGVHFCVLDGTTHVPRLKQLLDLHPNISIYSVPEVKSFYESFISGYCNTLAGEQFEVSETAVRGAGYTGEYLLGTNAFSKEPLAIVTRDGDPRFSDFVNWILQSLLAAEEQGITQAEASSFTTSNVFGDDFNTMFVNAIAAVGNYGEIYERHLENVVPRQAINTINKGDSGLIYALPLGRTDGIGPGPVAGGTLQKIIERGELRCGVVRRGFSQYNATTKEWSGFDVDFCRAISAAIFSGDSTRVLFRNDPATTRFTALASGEVDVLSRITTVNMVRDVSEPTAMVGFEFTQPNFYEGLSFGGIPPYHQCADNLDTTSQQCQDLKICVSDGTTDIENVRRLFPEEYIVVKTKGELALQGLAKGDCQVVAGGSVHDMSAENVKATGGYHGPYENGVKRFFKDPLALVTRPDDPQWTSFVNWVVLATFYAEEEGITQESASKMPITNLYGVSLDHMLRDVIRAVGSYDEIYERNVAAVVPRTGLNMPNKNPFGPQHYALPGL